MRSESGRVEVSLHPHIRAESIPQRRGNEPNKEPASYRVVARLRLGKVVHREMVIRSFDLGFD